MFKYSNRFGKHIAVSCAALAASTIVGGSGAAEAQISAAQSQTGVSCNGGTNGTASVSFISGGVAPYTFQWSPTGGTGPTASGLMPGHYTVTITDSTSPTPITQPFSFTLTQPTALTVEYAHSNVSTNGGNDGYVSVAASGGTPPYTFSWAPSGGTAASASGLTAGTYTVTIQDANGCTTTRSFTITQPAAVPAATVSSVAVPANGTYGVGQNLDFTVNFSSNVIVDTTGGIPHISLTVGSTTRYAAYVSGSSTSALTFRYTVQPVDVDNDGVTVGALSLNGGTIKSSGTNVTLTLNSVGSTAGVLVNGGAPSGPAAIPTLSEWAMIFLGGLLALLGAVYLTRRRSDAA